MLAIDHVNIRSQDVDALCGFYVDVFDLSAKKAPGTRHGYWLSPGQDKPALIHLVASETASSFDRPQLEHVGYRSLGLSTWLLRLGRLGHVHSVEPHPDFGLVRLGFRDLDGNRVHVDFPLSEHTAGGVQPATDGGG
jgi:catechol 2,3-dioxygenase-like lactoylglutathione lyase family enzyme